jgi:hypothetical protein
VNLPKRCENPSSIDPRTRSGEIRESGTTSRGDERVPCGLAAETGGMADNGHTAADQ